MPFLEAFRQDLRYTLRGLRAKPGFASAVVVTLALGIGANAAMFGIVDRMLFRPPPMLRDPATAHRIYTYETHRGQEHDNSGFQYARYRDLSQLTRSFSSTAAYTQGSVAIGTGDAAREVPVAMVSASFFGFFDAPPVIGRYFTAAEDSVSDPQPVVVLSHALWSTRFGESEDVLGQKIQIGQQLCTIIGVAPSGFVGLWPDQPRAIYIPITMYGSLQAKGFTWLKTDWWKTYHWAWSGMIARSKPGVSIQAADADLTNAMRRSYQMQLAESPNNSPITVVKPHAIAASILAERGPRRSAVAKVASWVGGVSVIVLLIACANVANLLLARALRRRREVAVRLALGVSRARLFSQLLIESLVLALLGGVAGLVMAQWGGAALRATLLAKDAPVAVIGDPRTILFAGMAALVVGVLAGLAPIAQTSAASGSLVDDLKTGAREGGMSLHGSRLRAVLLIVQGALSVVLLVGAGLFVRSLDNVRSTRLGYDVDPVMFVNMNMRGVTLDSVHTDQLQQRLLDAAKTVPGVTRTSYTAVIPFWGMWTASLFVPGIDSVDRLGTFSVNAVSPDYFATFGTRILRGRGFTARDTRLAPRVAVISQGMARVLWPGRDAIGQCMRVDVDTMPCTTVVGISEDIRQQRLSGDSALYMYYLPAAQMHANQGLAVRVAGDAPHFAEAVRRRLQQEMPGASYVTITPFSEVLGDVTKSWEMGATMFVVFGLLALVLAAVGLYSVIAYNVTQRTHEMGVRVALGAQVGDVVRLVVSDGARLGATGLLLGALVALAAGRWVKPLLFEQSPADPIVFGVVAAVLLGVTFAASWVPAIRAARVDPQEALRAE